MTETNQESDKFSQADELIKAMHAMDNNELKFLYYALSKREKGQLRIETTISDVLNKLKKNDGGNQYAVYSKAIKNIRVKSDMEVSMKADRYDEERRAELGLSKDDVVIIGGSLISTVTDPKTKKVIIEFKKDFLPLLDNLKKEHTWMYLEQVSRLDKKYSPRFYTFCKMHLKNQKETKFIWYLNSDSKAAPGMRQFLNVGDKYKDWRNFKRKVVDSSVDEINERCSDISVTYNVLKNVYVYAIELTICHKDGLHSETVIPNKDSHTDKPNDNLEQIIQIFPEDIRDFRWWDKEPCAPRG